MNQMWITDPGPTWLSTHHHWLRENGMGSDHPGCPAVLAGSMTCELLNNHPDTVPHMTRGISQSGEVKTSL